MSTSALVLMFLVILSWFVLLAALWRSTKWWLTLLCVVIAYFVASALATIPPNRSHAQEIALDLAWVFMAVVAVVHSQYSRKGLPARAAVVQKS